MPERGGPHFRVRFADIAWMQDLAHATPGALDAAVAVRGALERTGVARAALLRCDDEGRDGTRLGGCVKLRVPPPDGRWGLILQGARDDVGPLLVVVAFGERHPSQPWRPSVYQVAHHRIHGS